jgi:hypothetical protein
VKPNHFLAVAAIALNFTAACGGRDLEISRVSTSPSTGTGASTPSNVEAITVSGTITAIDRTGRTLVVNGTTVAVPASATVDGGRDGAGTFVDLQIGWGVTIRATRSGSTLTATAINVTDRGLPRVELDGRIAALKGSCPAVTFTVGSAVVTTSSSTVFAGTTCPRLANGESVAIDGTLQADNTISAARVSAQTNR